MNYIYSKPNPGQKQILIDGEFEFMARVLHCLG